MGSGGGGGGSVMCMKPLPWDVIREEVIGVLVKAKKEEKEGKSLYWLL